MKYFFQFLWFGIVLLSIPNLLNAKAEKTSDKSTLNYFFAAAKSNNIKELKQAVASGVNIESKDRQGRTALLVATRENAIKSAQFLIDTGADVNAKDNLQDSPYLYAGAEGRLEILKMTLISGADLKSINRYGGTALTPAAHHGHIDVVKLLLTTTIDINQVNFLGWTALLEAVILGDGGITYQQIVRLLLKAGADKTITDSDDVSALQHAKSLGQTKIIKLLDK